MRSDTITEVLRTALMVVALGCSWQLWLLHKSIRIYNKIPWVFAIAATGTYGVAVLLLLSGSHVVITDWWRPMWSILNMTTMFALTWLIARLVRRGGAQ